MNVQVSSEHGLNFGLWATPDLFVITPDKVGSYVSKKVQAMSFSVPLLLMAVQVEMWQS